MFDRLARHTSLFPVKPDKTPAVKNWQNEATQDVATISNWASQFPGHFGAPAGALNGFWVLDIDKHGAKNGFESFPRLKELPETLGQTTPSKGLHLFFKWDPNRPVRNKTDLAGMKGVDIRGQGGYVVICPSKGYSFTKQKVNFENDIVDAPDWLYDLILGQDDAKPAKTTSKPVDQQQLKDMLFALDPTEEKYESRDEWQAVLRAVHSGSNGEEWGKELFTEWSLRHPGPWSKSPEIEIERDWESYSVGEKANETTVGTLVHHIKEDGAIVPASIEDTIELATGEEIMLHRDAKGRFKATGHNAIMMFNKLVDFDGEPNPLVNSLAFDELRREPVWFRLPPWDRTNQILRPINDNDVIEAQAFLGVKAKVEFGKEKIADAMLAAANRNPNHPIKNYLNGLEWDGIERLSNWLPKWAGCHKDVYSQAVSRKIMIGAVKRIFEPGCKFDNMLVLEGPQGCRKSTLVEKLAKDWYASPNIPLNSLADGKNDAITNCFGSWIIEMEEMASATLADDKLLKKFLSTKVDVITLKYDKFKTEHPRQFVFIGTINLTGEGKYLKDISGNRRIWPIRVRKTKQKPVDIEKFMEDVDQLWAEAMVAYKNGEVLYLNAEEEAVAEREQAERMVTHHALDVIEDWVVANLKGRDKVHTSEIAHGIWGKDSKQSQINMVGQTMRSLEEWEYKRNLFYQGKNRSGWVRVTDEID